MSVLSHRGPREAMIARIVRRDGPDCFYCKIAFEEGCIKRIRTLDHFIPKSQGGRASFNNLRLACNRCNRLKADMTGDEFMASKILERRRFYNGRELLKRNGLHPKGGFWHGKVERISPEGTEVKLQCRVCGNTSTTARPLSLYPCITQAGVA